jgi:hypothetical protein
MYKDQQLFFSMHRSIKNVDFDFSRFKILLKTEKKSIALLSFKCKFSVSGATDLVSSNGNFLREPVQINCSTVMFEVLKQLFGFEMKLISIQALALKCKRFF